MRDFGKVMHAAILKMDNQQRPIEQHMELCSTLCASLNGRGIWGRMDTCICMAKSLCCSAKTATTLLIGYTPIQNKKFKVTNKKNKELPLFFKKRKPINKKFVDPISSHASYILPPMPYNHSSIFCLYEFAYSAHFI